MGRTGVSEPLPVELSFELQVKAALADREGWDVSECTHVWVRDSVCV